MIDWSIVLFFATGIIIFNLDQVAAHHSLYEFFQFRKELGIKQGTILLWMTFFIGASLYIPMYMIFHFGFMASILLALGFLIFLYVFIDKNLPVHAGQQQNVFDYYQHKFTFNGFKLFLPLIVFANLEGLLLQLALAQKVFGELFAKYSMAFMVLLLSFCIIIAGLGGLAAIYRAGYLILTACSFSLLVVPMFRYLTVGIHTIFVSYIPQKADLQAVMVFFGCLIMASIGKILTDAFLWQTLQAMKFKYRKSALKLSIFCFASIPFSVFIYGVYVLSRTHAESFSIFVRDNFQLPGTFMILLVFCVWISSVIHSIFTSIYSIAMAFTHILKLKKHDHLNVKILYGMFLILAAVIVLIQFWLAAYVKVLFISYFLFYLTVAVPLWILVRSRQRDSFWLPLFLISLWIFGIILWILTNRLLLAAGFELAGSIGWMAGLWIRKFLKWSKLRKIR